jgi:peptidyl-prolyl cis-trans isomerase B (cyclophilin B)
MVGRTHRTLSSTLRAVLPALGRAFSLGIGLTAVGCFGSEIQHRAPMPRDLLTDLADDGSLVSGLSHPDPAVRRVAMRALGRLPAHGSVDAVLAASHTEADVATLVEMCFAMGQWRAAEGETFLVRMTGNASAEVRAEALLALGKLGDDTLTPMAVKGLGDDSGIVRRAAALALCLMDGRRYDHPRRATEQQLTDRDEALAFAALQDPVLGVRWRAAYSLSNIRLRPGLTTALTLCAQDESSPLSRVFALRGLGHEDNEAPSVALKQALAHLDDPSGTVILEAARIVARFGSVTHVLDLAANSSSQIRLVALEGLRQRALEGLPASLRIPGRKAALLAAFRDLIRVDPSPAVRRELRATLAVLGRHAGEVPQELDPGAGDDLPRRAGAPPEVSELLREAGDDALLSLVSSPDPRDRERAARLLAEGDLVDESYLLQLLEDPNPSVKGSALGALAEVSVDLLWGHRDLLERALADPDPAVRGSAAAAVATRVKEGGAPPWLVTAVADALIATESFELEEARKELADALALPDLGPPPPTHPGRGQLLERLLAENKRALADPTPEVVLSTTRGDVRLVLDRVLAPRHVASFLELCEAGYYDGLDIHRVVANFVVQGLDPRHDGWGVAGRRLPDEFGRQPYLTGSLGMPHAGSPHTGGCQIFITHLPTPHLDGAYTRFGRVIDGMNVVSALEIGDVIRSARRVTPLPQS